MRDLFVKSKLNCYFYILPLLVIKGAGLIATSAVYKTVFLVTFGICIIIFLLTKERIEVKAFRLVAAGVLGISSLLAGSYSMLLLSGVILCVDTELDFKQFYRRAGIAWWCGMVIGLVLLILGIRKDSAINFSRQAFGVVLKRHAFGYAHANDFAATLVIGLILVAMALGERLDWKKIAILAIIEMLSFAFTGSITSLGVFALFSFLQILVIRKNTEVCRLLAIGCAILPVAILTLVFAYHPDRVFWRWLNILLTGRLFLAQKLRFLYGIPVIGQKLDADVGMQDIAYMDMLYSFGIIPCLLILGLYGIALHQWNKQKRLPEIIVCLCFLVYGMTEQFFRNCFMNITLILIATEASKWMSALEVRKKE